MPAMSLHRETRDKVHPSISSRHAAS